MYPTLLFDMDGTLIDSADGVFQSLRYAMESVGGPELPRARCGTFSGPPSSGSYKRGSAVTHRPRFWSGNGF
jgi:phosphoglycolate phosphatase